MTPLKQRHKHDPERGVWGDCHRAVIASLLELPLDEVPHFYDGGATSEVAEERLSIFLEARGLCQVNVAFEPPSDLHWKDIRDLLRLVGDLNPGVYYILGGASRNGTMHSVICFGDEIVHDPALDDSSVIAPGPESGLYWISFIASTVCMEQRTGTLCARCKGLGETFIKAHGIELPCPTCGGCGRVPSLDDSPATRDVFNSDDMCPKSDDQGLESAGPSPKAINTTAPDVEQRHDLYVAVAASPTGNSGVAVETEDGRPCKLEGLRLGGLQDDGSLRIGPFTGIAHVKTDSSTSTKAIEGTSS